MRAKGELLALRDYLIDQEDYDWSAMLSPWYGLVPEEFTLWMVNRFGDLIVVLGDGSIEMLDVSAGTRTRLAENRDEFGDRIDEEENANTWLMIPLVDACVQQGLLLEPGQCYSFTTPPILGGDYSVANTEVASIVDHYKLYGQLYQQLKDLPDGTQVSWRRT
ncbi:hypothetical protein Pan181_13580 [Aeoliella mucimassa]|uniref:T6SS immunity protein Tdi1 C-terminal domain-containing protein n=1 Tax=Aeoliella mucimassa TaxID=2527972 RepID=A0A518AKC4_9BACT|nr:hypothetical protein Pan181_13580 [Aeoliella mucimassa]